MYRFSTCSAAISMASLMDSAQPDSRLPKISAGGDRRRDKALFEAKFTLFTASMQDRAAALRDLAQEDKELRTQAVGQGPAAELAQKKLAFIRKFAFSPDLHALLNSYRQAKDAWLAKLDARKDASYVQKLTQGLAELNGALSG